MPQIPSWLTFAFAAALFGAISGFTSWLVNVNNFRKRNREIERLDQELEKANQELEKTNRRLITLDDPNWERVSREVRNTFHEARETFRQMRTDPLSRTLSLFIFTALLVSVMFAVAMRESTRMSARVAAATSELTSREKQLADLQQQTVTLRKELTAANDQKRQLIVSISQQLTDLQQQTVMLRQELAAGTPKAAIEPRFRRWVQTTFTLSSPQQSSSCATFQKMKPKKHYMNSGPICRSTRIPKSNLLRFSRIPKQWRRRSGY